MTIALLEPLWDDLKALLRAAGAVWGEPAELWAQQALERKDARKLRAWLAALEAVARALIAAMAERLAESLPTAGSPGARAGRRAAVAGAPPRDPSGDDPSAVDPPACEPSTDGASESGTASGETAQEPVRGSEAWAGVVFRITPPEERRSSLARGRRRPPRRCEGVRALAFRFEALIRVAENPSRYALRLARRLRARPGLVRAILRRPRPVAGDPPPFEAMVVEAFAIARRAYRESG